MPYLRRRPSCLSGSVMKRLAVFAAVAFVACSSDLTPQQRAVEEEAVGTRLQLWAKALNNRWVDSIAAVYEHTPTMTVAWPNGRVSKGWDDERQAEKDFFESISYMNLGVQNAVTVVVSPTVAVTTFRHSTDIVTNGVRQPVTSGPAMIVWVKDLSEPKQQEQWKIHAAQWSDVAAPAAPATPAAAKAPAKRR